MWSHLSQPESTSPAHPTTSPNVNATGSELIDIYALEMKIAFETKIKVGGEAMTRW